MPPDDAFRKALGKRISALRAAKGWTQVEVASKMQTYGHSTFTQPRQAEVEGGTNPVSLEEAISYCRIFGVPLARLLDTPDLAGY